MEDVPEVLQGLFRPEVEIVLIREGVKARQSGRCPICRGGFSTSQGWENHGKPKNNILLASSTIWTYMNRNHSLEPGVGWEVASSTRNLQRWRPKFEDAGGTCAILQATQRCRSLWSFKSSSESESKYKMKEIMSLKYKCPRFHSCHIVVFHMFLLFHIATESSDGQGTCALQLMNPRASGNSRWCGSSKPGQRTKWGEIVSQPLPGTHLINQDQSG